MDSILEVKERLRKGLGFIFSVTLAKVPEDLKPYISIPYYMGDEYKFSKYWLEVWDGVGNKIMTIFRYVPKNGGSVVYDHYEVMEKIYAWR